MTRALLRIRKGDDISPNEQDIGAFTGFMTLVFPKENESKPYCFRTLPKQPTRPIIYTLMKKAETVAESKNMRFIQFVGDHPDIFAHILPILAVFV